MDKSRAEHIAWCKQRALEYVELGRVEDAFMSMISDLRKHPDTLDHIGIELGFGLLRAGQLNTVKQMRKFIEDFN